MQVHLSKEEGGTWTIFIKRTLQHEGSSKSRSGVVTEDIEQTVADMVRQVRSPGGGLFGGASGGVAPNPSKSVSNS